MILFHILMWSHVTCKRSIFRALKLSTQKAWKLFPVQWVAVGRTKAKSARLILGENSLPFTQKSTRSYQVTRSLRIQQGGEHKTEKRSRCTRSLLHSHVFPLKIPQRSLHPSELLGVATTNWFVCQLEVNLGFSSARINGVDCITY